MIHFLRTLFEPTEMVCTSADVFGVSTVPLQIMEKCADQFFCINPLAGSRKDSNVTAFRNILIEFDNLEPGQQLKQLENVPYSTLVWSGGKSYHAIISLETACQDRAAYDVLVRRIHAKLPQADKSTKNPSRFSRSPGITRDNGNIQTLMKIQNRIATIDLEAWLGPSTVRTYETPKTYVGMLPLLTKHYLAFGSSPGMRNKDLYMASCDLARSGLGEREIFELVEPVADLPYHEIGNTIKSAIRKIQST